MKIDLLLCSALLTLAIGCAKQEPYFRVSPQQGTYNFPVEGGVYDINVETSSATWTATATAGVFSVTKNEAGVQVKASPFYTSSSSTREDDITITAEGFETITVHFSQPSYYLNTNKTSFSFDDEGGSFEIAINSNMSWQITVDSDWITVAEKTGEGKKNVSVQVSPNTNTEASTGTITVKAESLMFTVSVTRDGFKTKYALGDIYPDTSNPQGVVISISNGGRTGKAIALKDSYGRWSNESFLVGTSATDGMNNTNKAIQRGDKVGGYQIFYICRAKGENWYLPALNEVESAVSVIKSLSDKEALWQSYGWESLGTVIMTSTEASATQYQAWQTGSTPFKNLNKSTTTYSRAMCQF
ncbi:MAG: BACON domain-containing protein [Bacteroidales bacterium]|nr:BACON domain-containing protein [Bacteroidales bacterium]